MLLAANLEDVDFAQLATPIVNSMAPSLLTAVPGFQGVGNLLINSLANGSANAFLTLRVGLIAKAYCAPMVEPNPRAVRKSSTLAALNLLVSITKENGSALAAAVWQGAKGILGKTTDCIVTNTKLAASKTVDAVKTAADMTTTAVGSAGVMARDAAVTTVDTIQKGATHLADSASDVGKGTFNASVVAAGKVAGGAKAVVAETSRVG